MNKKPILKMHRKRPSADQQEESLLPRKKKMFGQHFLRKPSVVMHMVERVCISSDISVLEIGPGDGYLSRAILEQSNCKKLRAYEIDTEWADYLAKNMRDKRFELVVGNVLEQSFNDLEGQGPWVILANLPYQVTFPIIFKIKDHKHLFAEGVIMVQEEVAQKIVATRGKTYNPTSMLLQHHFNWELMEKIEPGAFTPPPKVFSRLLYFKPRFDVVQIPSEEEFWKFIKFCFKSPRQTIKNNLRSTHYADHCSINSEVLALRAQQMSFQQFFDLWLLILADQQTKAA